MIIDPVQAQRLSGVLLMDQGSRLALDSPIVALDNQVLAGAAADKLGAVAREPELGGQRMAVVLPGEPVRAPRESRLEDVGGVRAAVGEVPVTVEPGEQQLRLQAGEHGAALLIGAEVAVIGGPLEALDDLAVTDRLVTRLRLACRVPGAFRPRAGARPAGTPPDRRPG